MIMNLEEEISLGLIGNTYLWKPSTPQWVETTVIEVACRVGGDYVVISTDNNGKPIANDLSRFLEAIAQ